MDTPSGIAVAGQAGEREGAALARSGARKLEVGAVGTGDEVVVQTQDGPKTSLDGRVEHGGGERARIKVSVDDGVGRREIAQELLERHCSGAVPDRPEKSGGAQGLADPGAAQANDLNTRERLHRRIHRAEGREENDAVTSRGKFPGGIKGDAIGSAADVGGVVEKKDGQGASKGADVEGASRAMEVWIREWEG